MPPEPPTQVSALETLLNSMEVGQWSILSTSGMNNAIHDDGANNHILAFANNMEYDPVAKKIWFYGGDHGGGTPRLVSYDVATNAWTNHGFQGFGDNYHHGYNNNWIDVAGRRLGNQNERYMNLDNVGNWTNLTQDGSHSIGRAHGGWQYLPGLGIIQAADNALYVLEDGGSSWERLDNGSNFLCGRRGPMGAYVPSANCVIIGGGMDGNNFYRVDTNKQFKQIAAHPTVDRIACDGLNDECLWVGDPVSDLIHFIYDAADPCDHWVYDLISDEWYEVPNIAQHQFMSPCSSEGYGDRTICKLDEFGCIAVLESNRFGTDTQFNVYKANELPQTLEEIGRLPSTVNHWDFYTPGRGADSDYHYGSLETPTANNDNVWFKLYNGGGYHVNGYDNSISVEEMNNSLGNSLVRQYNGNLYYDHQTDVGRFYNAGHRHFMATGMTAGNDAWWQEAWRRNGLPPNSTFFQVGSNSDIWIQVDFKPNAAYADPSNTFQDSSGNPRGTKLYKPAFAEDTNDWSEHTITQTKDREFGLAKGPGGSESAGATGRYCQPETWHRHLLHIHTPDYAGSTGEASQYMNDSPEPSVTDTSVSWSGHRLFPEQYKDNATWAAAEHGLGKTSFVFYPTISTLQQDAEVIFDNLIISKTRPPPIKPSMPIYARKDIIYPLLESVADPYDDVWITATFFNDGVEQFKLLGFWNGGTEYRIRFSPKSTGTWTWITASNQPSLNNLRGTIEAFSSAVEKGWIEVDSSYQHHFKWSNGSRYYPFLAGFNISGYDQVSGCDSFKHGGCMSGSTFQAAIKERTESGFTGGFWGEILTKDNHPIGLQNESGHTAFGTTTTNLSNQIEPQFFQWMDKRIEWCVWRGFIPSIGLAWPNTTYPGWDDTQGKKLLRYLIARYSAYPHFWMLFGEADDTTDWQSWLDGYGDILEGESSPINHDGDPYGNPTTVHLTADQASSVYTTLSGKSWYDFHAVNVVNDEVAQKVVDLWPDNIPVVLAEFNARDDATGAGACANDDQCRIWFWNAAIRGGYPVYDTNADSGVNYTTPLANYVKHLIDFFAAKNLHLLSADDSIISNGKCAKQDGTQYIIYLEDGGTVNLNLSNETGFWGSEWFNCRDGSAQSGPVYAGGAFRSYTAPTSGVNIDWALHIAPIASSQSRLEIYNTNYLQYGGSAVALFGMGNYWTLSDPGVDYEDMISAYSGDGSNYMRISLFGHTVAKRAGLQETDVIHPFARSSTPGANDGGNKFDLTQFNTAYFERLDGLSQYAYQNDVFIMYVLWDEIPLELGNSRWEYNPFNPDNNINNLGLPSDAAVPEFYDLNNSELLSIQEAFLERVLDTMSQYGNTFFTISNEYTGSEAWHRYWVDYINDYEIRSGVNPILTNELEWSGFSPDYTDFISHRTNHTGGSTNWRTRPVVNHKTGPKFERPTERDAARKAWWSVFVNGGHTSDDSHDGGDPPDQHNSPNTLAARAEISAFRNFINRLPINEMVPYFVESSGLISAGEGRVKLGEHYVVYLDDGGSVSVDLSQAVGTLNVEWYNPRAGTVDQSTTTTGGASRQFTAPDSNDWALYIYS